jgi:hypothetical protein
MTPKEVSGIVNLGNQNKETQMSPEGLYKEQLIFWIPFLNSAHKKLIVTRNIVNSTCPDKYNFAHKAVFKCVFFGLNVRVMVETFKSNVSFSVFYEK